MLVASKGYRTARAEVTVAEGKEQEVTLHLEPEPSQAADAPEPAAAPGHSTLAYVSLGVGAAGLVMGSIFGALALGDQGTLKGQRPTPSTCPGSQQSEIDTLHLNEVLGDVGFGVGVVGVGLGAVLLLTSGPSEPSPTALRLDVGPSSIALHGRF